MKKLVALTMATAMTLSLAACGGASSSSSIHRHDGHGILCRRIHGL